PRRVVQLIPVDAEAPRLGSRVALDRAMRIAGVMRSTNVELAVLACERLQDLPGPVGGDVVEGVNRVAEPGRVADRLLEEDVFVTDEENADDPGRHRSSVVHSS